MFGQFGPKWTIFWTKLAKHGRPVSVPKWSKRVQKGPKGTKMVNLSVFDHLGPFWAHLDPFGPFQTKMNFLPQMDKVGFVGGASEQKINFCLKGSRWAQKCPKWSKTLRLTILVPFGPFWTTLERWQACHVWPFLVQNGPFLGH